MHPNTIQTDRLSAISDLYLKVVPPVQTLKGLAAHACKIEEEEIEIYNNKFNSEN